MGKKGIAGLLASVSLIVAIAISASLILAADSSDEVALDESTVSLEESGARIGQFADLSNASFTPELSNEQTLSIAHEFVSHGMNLDDVGELPTRIASAKFSGQRHDNGEHAANTKVRVVVFHDYPDWPRLPFGYSGPKPVDPRYTVIIDDHTRDVVFSVLTWGREGDAKITTPGHLGGSDPPAYVPQESILDLSNPSDLPLDYPWSASEQAQREIAIERRDANLLPECTEHYFAWRDATRERTEAARGTEPPPGGFWAAPGCKGTPDRLVIGPLSGPGPAAGHDQARTPGSGISHGNTSLLGTPGGSRPSTPPPPKPTPSPPTHIPEPRPSQDTLSAEEREEIKARRDHSRQEWGLHTAGTVIEIAGRQVQLPEDVHVMTVISEGLCAPGKSCVDLPAWVLQRGDLLFTIAQQSGRPAPGRDIPEAFEFIREFVR